ncbi:MAG: hypothetical protein U0L83_02125 [Muribaculaceae bacterium]|nr:hypothetical protein [Muribaculaceae bacterium]
MNRLIYVFVALLAMVFASCSQSDPVDKAVKILEKASSRVEKASTEDEAMEITRETAEELKTLRLDEQKLTPAEQGRLTNAIMGFMQACMKSKIDFTKGTEVLDLTESDGRGAKSTEELPSE